MPGDRQDCSGAQWCSRPPYPVMLLKHPLHKLVAKVVELGAAAGGHVEPVGTQGVPGPPGERAEPGSRLLSCRPTLTSLHNEAPRGEAEPGVPPHSRWDQVVRGELQRVSIAEAPQDGPCGLVAAALDEQRVQEKKACGERGGRAGSTGHGAPLPGHRQGTSTHRPGSAGRRAPLQPRSCVPPSSHPPGPAGPGGARSRISAPEGKWPSASPSVTARCHQGTRDRVPEGWGPHLEGVELLVTERLV